MSFTDKYTRAFRLLLPTPFTIAIILTIVSFFLALFSTKNYDQSYFNYSLELLEYWENGLWNNNLIVFAFQMMLMLVLGHVLALTNFFNTLIKIIVKNCTNTAKAAAIVTFFTIIVSLFNWGLGLIFGAILARKVGEYASKHLIKINYSLIGAAGYSGLMVWHGGLSGSSLAKVAEPGHIKTMMTGIIDDKMITYLPEKISYSETFGSNLNLFVTLMLLIILPAFMYFFGKSHGSKKVDILSVKFNQDDESSENLIGAEKIDHSKIFSLLIGFIFLFVIGYKIHHVYNWNILDFFTPNNINFLLFGLGLVLHKNIVSFIKAVDEAILGASGIIIQFPLYFGIMGIMKDSGLINEISNYFVSISNKASYPILTFLSAAIVNIFVPSGGGQWAVQGPIIVKAALDLKINLPKCIMALAYGDQLTNMLQPFWALPLLGITGLKAKDILPYTLMLMFIGLIIFTTGLLMG
ncbi:MAG: short-chain fatty acid transporter [Vicingaceae bacterium]